MCPFLIANIKCKATANDSVLPQLQQIWPFSAWVRKVQHSQADMLLLTKGMQQLTVNCEILLVCNSDILNTLQADGREYKVAGL